jgi:hypothetical protein
LFSDQIILNLLKADNETRFIGKDLNGDFPAEPAEAREMEMKSARPAEFFNGQRLHPQKLSESL